ncbi:MAG: DNA-(apurinic or apyrimidinic site) lyase [Nitrospirae bacterium]|nr:DNA-(apurinic or apyrimidinic site) lyase [Nitrospirota bacterium]
MPGREYIADLKRDYRAKKRAIEKRLSEFRAVYDRGDEAIFEELCFCILTAGSSARMGMLTIAALRDILLTGSEKELQQRAGKHRVRFWRLRPSYIHCTREHLKETCDLRLRDLLGSFDDPIARRDFLAKNKAIKGLGYKESSHGFRGYAILDKHIVNSLREMGVIGKRLKPTSRKGYLAIEKKLARFAEDIGIDMDHLDLLLWSRKTGEILK